MSKNDSKLDSKQDIEQPLKEINDSIQESINHMRQIKESTDRMRQIEESIDHMRNNIVQIKQNMDFPYQFLGGLSIFGLVGMGLYYYDQKYFRKEDTVQWDLRTALAKFKKEMQQERELRIQQLNEQKLRMKKQMRLERQVRLILFKKEMDHLKMALQMERNARTKEFSKQMEQLCKQSTQERNNRVQLKSQLQNIRKELKVQKEARAAFNKEIQNLRKQLYAEKGSHQAFKAVLQDTKTEFKQQNSISLILTKQMNKFMSQTRLQKEFLNSQLQNLTNEMGSQRNNRINFTTQLNKFTKQAKYQRDSWKSQLKSQFQAWKSQKASLKMIVQSSLDKGWKQMASLRSLINEFKQTYQQRVKKDVIGRFDIIPFINNATWKGKQSIGGYSWFFQSLPKSTGKSSPNSGDFNKQFSKMNTYFTYLNILRTQTLTVAANTDNLGQSCWPRIKTLILQYQCYHYDRKYAEYLKPLNFVDTKETIREVQIQENIIAILDCKDAKRHYK